MSRAYYNELDPYAAAWLRNLIAERLIPAGDVDERSIADVQPADLAGYRQCHFFAGIGGWALAARLAGWPDDRELWTGSPPFQPFSVAGKGKAQSDDRHLWPHYFRLIRARRPAVAMGEQVAAAVGKDWLDGVLADLEGIGYAGRAAVVPACAVDAPHRRDRLWIVTERTRLVGDGIGAGLEGLAGNDNDSTGWAQQDRPVAEAGSGGDVADAGHAERRADLAGRYDFDGAQAERHESYRDARECGGSVLADAVREGPQPAHTAEYVAEKKAQGHGMSVLPDYVALAATGTAPPGLSGTTEKPGALNPAFVCWLMGFPPEWDASAPTAMPSSRKSRRK